MDPYDAHSHCQSGDRWLYELHDETATGITAQHVANRLEQIHERVSGEVHDALQWWDVFDSIALLAAPAEPWHEVAEFSLAVRHRPESESD